MVPPPAGCDAGAATAIGPEDELDEAGSEPKFGFGALTEGPVSAATAEPDTPTGAGVPMVAGGPEGTDPEVGAVTAVLAGAPTGLPGAGAVAGAATVTDCEVGAV